MRAKLSCQVARAPCRISNFRKDFVAVSILVVQNKFIASKGNLVGGGGGGG